jgi:integrase
VHPHLALFLEELKPTQVTTLRDPTILQTRKGQPWNAQFMQEAVFDHCEKIGIEGRTLHGIRKTTASVLAEMGCTPYQIMAITGHTSLKEVERYTIEAEQKRLASGAMEKWKGTGHAEAQV